MGREREIAELLASLEDSLSGRGHLVLLSGEPGIGKSRLADEFATQANERGARVLWGRCWEAGGAPAYWPWIQLLRTYLRSEDPGAILEQMGSGAADIARMLPEIHDLSADLPPPPSVDPESARFQLFDSVGTFLLNAGNATPLSLVLDDLQSADTPSLLLLRFLVGQISEGRILVLGIYRDVEVTPDHPLSETLAELARAPVTRHIALPGLDEDDVARYIEATAAAVPGPSLASTLYRQTKGNPLFLGEAVRLLVAEGYLEEDTEATSLRIAVPWGIRDVILRRVDHLGPDCKKALAQASVLGQEFALEPVRRLSNLSADQLLELFGEAVRAGLLFEVPGGLGRFHFSHDMVREVLYEGLGPARRARLHRRAAEVLEEMYRQDTEAHLAELAHHFFEGAPGGDPVRAVEYARRAADQAARSLAYEEAARLYQMGLQAMELEERPDQEILVELLLGLGDAQARAGDLPNAGETFLRAVEVARRTGAASQLARAALGYGGRFVWARAGSDPHLIPMLQDALVLLGGSDDRLRVRLLGRLAGALRFSPDREHTAALSEQAVDLARRLDDPSTLAYALVARCWAVWWPENPEERLEIGRELLQVAEEARDGERIVDGHITIACTLIELGAMTEARAEFEAVERKAEELRQPAQMWLAAAPQAFLALLEGAFDAAEKAVHETLRFSPAVPVRDNVSAAGFNLFLLRREQGRVAEVEETVRTALGEFPWYPVYRCALACLLLDLRRESESRGIFDELARNGFRDLNRDNEWLLSMSLAGEACAGLGDAAAADVLYMELLPFAGRHAIGVAEGSVGAVDRYLGLLAETAGRPDDAEAHFRDGIDVNERMGARPWVAHTKHDYARMLLARDGPGDREQALELLGSSLEICRELGMVALEQKATSLLADLGEAPTPTPAPVGPSPRPSVFRREGEYFSIAFEGDAFRLKDAKGLRYLALLLASPGREIHALDLASSERGTAEVTRTAATEELPSSRPGDAGEILDAQAKAEYKRRLAELEEELEEAESFGDAERAARAREERDFLARELATAVGLGGRDRVAASASERARVNVTRAIRSSMARIAEHSSVLGRHLDATVRTGTFCSYTPDPRAAFSWQL